MFLRYILFAMLQLVHFCNGYQTGVSAAEQDKILCISDRIRLNGKIAVLEAGDLGKRKAETP